MRQAGAVLMAIGGLLALWAFSMDTTVYSSGTFVGGQFVGGGSTHNLGLLQQQMMFLHTGLAGFLAGAFLYGGSGSVAESSGSNEGLSAKRQWSDVQEGETYEERDERVERNRRRSTIVYWVLIILGLAVLISPFIFAAPPSSDLSQNLMNMDLDALDAAENLTVND